MGMTHLRIKKLSICIRFCLKLPKSALETHETKPGFPVGPQTSGLLSGKDRPLLVLSKRGKSDRIAWPCWSPLAVKAVLIRNWIFRPNIYAALLPEGFAKSGVLVTTVWRVLRLRMDETASSIRNSCEYIEKAVADSR